MHPEPPPQIQQYGPVRTRTRRQEKLDLGTIFWGTFFGNLAAILVTSFFGFFIALWQVNRMFDEMDNYMRRARSEAVEGAKEVRQIMRED